MKFLLILLLGYSALAKTILVTDIDDTLKVAHIRSTIGTISNAYRTKNIFLGMNELISSVKKDANADIYYLTNAPAVLMGASHRALLRNGKFPEGTLLLRQSGVSSDVHKITALNTLIQRESPDTVVLIGDNGEKDIKFYKTIMNTYPGINFKTYIRIAYSIDDDHKPLRGQSGFISSLEIAADLYKEGLIDLYSVDNHFNRHAPKFIADTQRNKTGMMYLPKWLRCQGHTSFNTLFAFEHPWLSIVKKKIQKVCSRL